MVDLYAGGTEYVRDPVTLGFGTVDDIASVGYFHAAAGVIPTVADFTAGTLVKADTDPLWDGKAEVVTLIGARLGAVALAAGDWQRWILITTADEDIIRASGTITVTGPSA